MLAPAASPAAAQGGPPHLGPPPISSGPGYTQPYDELVIAGQTQVCSESAIAVANHSAYWGPPYGNPPGVLWGFPWYAHTNLVPYGGFWGFYLGAGSPVCLWRPR
jgi:hypothetical protein